MGKRIIRFLLGTLYVVLVAALLIAHTRQIAAESVRALALLETLLLAVPAIAVLALHVRLQESEADGEASPGAPDVSEIATPERLREKILAAGQTSGKTDGSVLTQREWEIAWLLYRGYTNRQIAEEYCIAETTVKKHASHIYEKLQVSGRKEFKEKYKL